MRNLNKILQNIISIKFTKNSCLSTYIERRLTINFLGLKLSCNFANLFKPKIHKALLTHCDIENLDHVLSQETIFTHITGIVVNKDVKIGKHCKIKQNVTIGLGKYFEETGRDFPILGDRVDVGPGSIIIGGITIGDDVIIGAGSVVVKDIPSGATVVGNPARVIKIKKEYMEQTNV